MNSNFISVQQNLKPMMEIHGKRFSPRECEVLFHLVRGKTAKAIGKTLMISPRTVEQHMENIKLKMQVFSKAQLIEKVVDYFV